MDRILGALTMSYQLTETSSVIRKSDGANIPNDPENIDWQAYQEWLGEDNNPSAVDQPTAVQKWAIFQQQAQAALIGSDITALRCYESSVPVPVEWVTYRKELRAIVGASMGDPAQPLPEKPDSPAGT